jgi:hypothetical protein
MMNKNTTLFLIGALIAFSWVATPTAAVAQEGAAPEMDHSKHMQAPAAAPEMDHSKHMQAPAAAPEMDHSKHMQAPAAAPEMDHSKHMQAPAAAPEMDHSKHMQAPAAAPEMDHSKHMQMDHSAHMGHAGHNMTLDMQGMVMNENTENLPKDCAAISGEEHITIRGGTKHAEAFDGFIFAFDKPELNVAPCSKVTVTFINDDTIRHQWMVHGLPKYLYPQGMFHMEVNGPGQKTGTFIVPSAKKTYFVHCDISHHTEQGMIGQIKVSGGDSEIPGIPGLTAQRYPDAYPVEWSNTTIGLLILFGFAGIGVFFVGSRYLS